MARGNADCLLYGTVSPVRHAYRPDLLDDLLEVRAKIFDADGVELGSSDIGPYLRKLSESSLQELIASSWKLEVASPQMLFGVDLDAEVRLSSRLPLTVEIDGQDAAMWVMLHHPDLV